MSSTGGPRRVSQAQSEVLSHVSAAFRSIPLPPAEFTGEGALEHQNGQDCPDGVAHDSLPLHDRGDLAGWFDHAEERSDHGRPGHHQDSSEKGGHSPVPLEDPRCTDTGERKTEDDTQRAEAQDRSSSLFQFRELQGESTLEKNDCDKESDDSEEGVGFSPEVIIDACSGGERQAEAKSEENEDGGDPEAPGQPLREDSQGKDEGEVGNWWHGRDCA